MQTTLIQGHTRHVPKVKQATNFKLAPKVNIDDHDTKFANNQQQQDKDNSSHISLGECGYCRISSPVLTESNDATTKLFLLRKARAFALGFASLAAFDITQDLVRSWKANCQFGSRKSTTSPNS
eukprot:GHVP01016124.1.p2 GENE.GHVP01016124.1~~GHVP01016124.1.p2  ORF type:complete len:124 (-),score=8.80 GHVP01016124.1:434-805(-)